MAKTTAQVDGWELRTIYISRDEYTEGKPFTGRVQFNNKEGEEVAFNIPKDKLHAIVQLICDSTQEAAKRMGVEIAKVLPSVLSITALPPAKEEHAAEVVEEHHAADEELDF